MSCATSADRAPNAAALGVAAVAAFVVFLDTTIVNVAFPSMSRAFHSASRADVALTLTVYATVLGAVLIPGGRLADYWGRRRVFLTALAGFVAASALCGLAPSLEVLVAARIAQAAAAAIMAPASLALMLSEYPERERTYVVGLWSAAAGAATAFGPALGGVIVDGIGWRYVFWVNVPIGLVALGVGMAVLRETRDPQAIRPDALGVALAAAAAALLTTGLFDIAGAGRMTSAAGVYWLLAAILASLCRGRGRAVANQLVASELWRQPGVLAATLATFLTSAAGFALLFNNVLFLSSIWHYSALEQGLAVTPGPIVTALVVVPAARLAQRFGARAVALPGLVLLSAGALWFYIHVGAQGEWVRDWLPGALLTGAGIGLSFPTIAGAAIAFARAGAISTAVAVNGAIRQVGAVVGISAIVCVVGAPSGAHPSAVLHRGWMLVASMSLAGGLALLAPQWPRLARG